jgi:hypothetical protein
MIAKRTQIPNPNRFALQELGPFSPQWWTPPTAKSLINRKNYRKTASNPNPPPRT